MFGNKVGCGDWVVFGGFGGGCERGQGKRVVLVLGLFVCNEETRVLLMGRRIHDLKEEG